MISDNRWDYIRNIEWINGTDLILKLKPKKIFKKRFCIIK